MHGELASLSLGKRRGQEKERKGSASMNRTSGEGVVGSIGIELDRKVYAPGDTVSGSVSLTALEPIRSKEPLALVITGKEEVQWDETDSPSSTSNDHTFLNHKIVLTPNVMSYSPGESVFLFSFELPPASQLPSSFALADVYSGKLERLRAEIKYAATVWLTAADRASVAYLSSVESFTVHVSPQQLEPPVRAFEVSSTERIRFLCCFHRGGLHVTATTSKDVFLAGEPITIQCRVDNQASQQPIRRIRVELLQDVTLCSSDASTAPIVVTRGMAKLEFAGPEVGATWEQLVAIPTFEDPSSISSDQPRREAQRLLDPCVDAKLLSCAYRVVIKCKPLASRSITTELPVRIIHGSTSLSPAGIVVDVGRAATGSK